MNGVILSHTKMGRATICTTIAVRENGIARQIRARIAPNAPLPITHFGYSAESMDTYWQPGRMVEFDQFAEVPQEYRRASHPEDVIIVNPEKMMMEDGVYDADGLAVVVAPFTFPSFRLLYPNIRKQTTNDKGWMEDGVTNPRSVGYVRCNVRILPPENGNQFVRVTDQTQYSFVCRLKDEALLAQVVRGEIAIGTVFENALVRFSLSDRLNVHENWRHYVMLSHIVR